MDTSNTVDTSAHFHQHLETVIAGQTLSQNEAHQAFAHIMGGHATDIELAGFLVALKTRGETVEEIAGAVAAMTEIMIAVKAPEGAIDIVGTGGDMKGTYNISTASAFVLAGAGVPVAKHGNRAASSKTGAADVLEKLGVNIHLPPSEAERCFAHAGIAFLWAPQHHPAMRHAAAVRKQLRLRTMFNLLGPLLNPASTRRQLIGAYAENWIGPMAEVMRRRNAIHIWAVHGADGMDELSTTGDSYVVEVKDGEIKQFTVHPRDAGVDVAYPSDLTAETADDSASAMRALFDGRRGPFRDIVILNSAAAFLIAGRAKSLEEGAAMAGSSIDGGKAGAALDALIACTQQ